MSIAGVHCRTSAAKALGRSIAIACLVLPSAASLLIGTGVVSTAMAGSCGGGSTRWWAGADSGTGSTVLGTGAYTTTWTSWSVHDVKYAFQPRVSG
jgi:hypothetical protein